MTARLEMQGTPRVEGTPPVKGWGVWGDSLVWMAEELKDSEPELFIAVVAALSALAGFAIHIWAIEQELTPSSLMRFIAEAFEVSEYRY